MEAMSVRRLSESQARYYLDGRRVSRADWDAAHLGRRIDTIGSRTHTRKDGSVLVRAFHCIRPKGR